MSILTWVKILDSLSDSERESLSLFCQSKKVLKWEKLFNEWDDATAMYILIEWEFKIYQESSWWKKVLWIMEPENILWEMALFSERHKRVATAEAMEDSQLITILWFSIKEMTTKNPELLSKIKEIVEGRENKNKSLK